MKKASLLPILMALMIPTAAFSEVKVDSTSKGLFVLTTPDGGVTILEEGDPIPSLSNGSQLEVFDGEATVSTQQTSDSVQLACLENKVQLFEDQTANLSCSENAGKLKAVKGNLNVTLNDGTKVIVKEGEEYNFGDNKTAAETAAPETGAIADLTGTTPNNLGDIAPVDSRSIESSPAQ